jgi:hypothetical protein
MDGRDWRTIPRNGDIPEIKVRTGHCRLLPPRPVSDQQSTFPIVFLGWKCGQHSYGWAGFWRAVGRLFNREDQL